MRLPKPPEPAMVYINATGYTTRCHNETQLLEYGRQCAEQMREACAAECDKYNFGQAPAMIERAIRALEIEG
jgi:hypothetical protein